MTCYFSLPSLVPSAPYPWTPGATSAPRAVAGVPPPPRAARWPRRSRMEPPILSKKCWEFGDFGSDP